MSGPNRAITEREKRIARKRHQREIRDALDKARVCRKQYNELPEAAEIDHELYKDLDVATFRLYSELRPALMNTDYRPTIESMGEKLTEVAEADCELAEIEDFSPESLIGMIDWMESVIQRTDLLEVEQ